MSDVPAARVRRGGVGGLGDEGRVVWSVADGTRGRRWREAVIRDDAVVRSCLFEVDHAGRWARLEMTSRHGLLTLHPEPDLRHAHGNVVGRDGVRHIAVGWSPDHALLVTGSPASAAILVARLAGNVGHGKRCDVEVLAVDDRLLPEAIAVTVSRIGARGWALERDGQDAWRFELDDDGVFVLGAAATWPLELHTPG